MRCTLTVEIMGRVYQCIHAAGHQPPHEGFQSNECRWMYDATRKYSDEELRKLTE